MVSSSTALSPLALSTLALLVERPMHPYEMHQLMLTRRRDRLVKVRPSSVYHTVDRLVKDGYVTSVGTERAGNRPERTVYDITESGQDAVLAGSIGMLRTPINEHPRFTFALSEAHNVSRETMISLMSARRDAIQEEIEEIDAALAAVRNKGKPRRFFIDAEYTLSQLVAQSTWIKGLLDDLTSGALEWAPSPVANS